MTDPNASAITDEVAMLWVARETGVLDALLSTAGTPEDVAEEAGISERGARILTRALADRGFFELVDGEYEPANRSLGFLTRRDPRSIGSLPHRVDLLERYAELPEALAAGRATAEPDHWTEHRLGRVAATDEATVRATVTAAVRADPDAETVLDVGGAPGTFAKEFVRRGFEVTLCDRPDAVEVARPFLAREPIDLVECDPDDPGPLPDADLAVLPDVTHRLGPEANRRLLSAVGEALGPGGTVVVVDALRERSRRAATVAVEALASTPEGDAYDADRYREWLSAAGFGDPTVEDVPGTDRQAVVAVREP